MSQNSANINENDYFEDQSLAFLPADHPLMGRLQDALKKTLEEGHERVHLQLKEKENNLKIIEREREDIGVQLYEVQQSLAQLHINLEQTHENYNLIQRLRVEAEHTLEILHKDHDTKKVQIDRLDKNVIKTQDELARLTRTFKQIEEYNDKLKSEVQITRTAAYRAEENISLQEKSKKNQDFLIDHITEQKKNFTEQLSVMEAQLLSQKDETKAAKEILREAFNEMQNIIASKKNLLERWQKSLLDMQKRDKALQIAREALKVQFELSIRVNTEINGVNNETKKEVELSETLLASLQRLKLEQKHLDEEKKKLDHNMEKLNAQVKILQQSLHTTETSAQAVERDNKKIEEQMSVVEDNIMKIHGQVAILFDQFIVKINEHKTLEKTTANILKQAQQIEQSAAEKEIEKENIENEIARVGLDTLNTNNQLEVLRAKKRDVSEERKKKEATVTTYGLEIKQGHDINEKKQSEVGKLNKIHDQIVNSVGETNLGSLDAQISHIMHSIKEETEKTQRLEKDWIKKQTKLVKHQEHLAEVSEESSTMKTKKTILEQKKMRMQAAYQKHEKEIREIKISLKNMQTEMNKLNDGLAKNQSVETKLKNENFHVQSEIVEKLKELEKDNVKLEVDIDNLKEQKAELLENIVETERQLLLWERKIQLEKEFQAALDPNVGQAELKVLKKEIHRMELRLEEIRKTQEKTIQEMEKAVYKREFIQQKYAAVEESAGQKGMKETKTKIAKQIDTLRDALTQTTKNNKDYDKKLRQLQSEIDERNRGITETQTATEEGEEHITRTMTELNQKKIERVRGVFDIVKIQTIYKAYESIAANRFKLEVGENTLRQRYEKQRETNNAMIGVLRDVADSHPHYAEVMRSLLRIN